MCKPPAGTNSCKNVPAEQKIARPKSQSAEQTKSTLHCAAAAFLLLSLFSHLSSLSVRTQTEFSSFAAAARVLLFYGGRAGFIY
jgi:hypothetical protein